MTLWNIYRVKDGWYEDIVKRVRSEKKPRVSKGYKAVRGKFTFAQMKAINKSLEEYSEHMDYRLAYPAAHFHTREGL